MLTSIMTCALVVRLNMVSGPQIKFPNTQHIWTLHSLLVVDTGVGGTVDAFAGDTLLLEHSADDGYDNQQYYYVSSHSVTSPTMQVCRPGF